MRARILSLVVAAAVPLAACAEPSHEYVRNTDLRAAFRVPVAWTTFDEGDVLGTPPGPQPDVPDPVQWLVGIDGNPQPAPEHVQLSVATLTADHPVGLVLVQDLSFVERDEASLSYLRNFLLPVDQLLQDDSDARVLSYEETVDEDGVQGVHLVFQFRAASLAELSATEPVGEDPTGLQTALLGGQGVGVLSPEFVQVDQAAYLDAQSDRVYFMAVMCDATCYARDRSDIEATLDSWTVIK